MVRVLVADDEAMVRAGVRAILARDPDIDVVAEATQGLEAVEAVRAHRPAVALLDIQMPVLGGIAAAARIHRELPGTAVVMLTTFGEDAFIADALRAGADGFLLKADDPRELLNGVHAVAAGGAYLSPRVAARVVSGLRSGALAGGMPTGRPAARLTERESAVLALLGAACPTPRSPAGCTSSRERSRRTSAPSSPSWAYATGWRRRSWPGRAAWSGVGPTRPMYRRCRVGTGDPVA